MKRFNKICEGIFKPASPEELIKRNETYGKSIMLELEELNKMKINIGDYISDRRLRGPIIGFDRRNNYYKITDIRYDSSEPNIYCIAVYPHKNFGGIFLVNEIIMEQKFMPGNIRFLKELQALIEIEDLSKKPIEEEYTPGKYETKLIKPGNDKNIWWHGSASGDLSKAWRGIHLGTYQAAKEALEATIGIPVEGTWDGTREYGKTLIAGKIRCREMGENCGYNCDCPDEDHYPTGKATFGSYDKPISIPLNVKPTIDAYKIIGPMTNSHYSPYNDTRANAMMSRQIKMGNARSGFYYVNDAEDYGSISAVVPNAAHLEKITGIERK